MSLPSSREQGELQARSQSLKAMRWLPLLLLAGCLGRLSNDALTVGAVSGQLEGAEAAQAQVFLLGLPKFVAKTDSAGRFTFTSVPLGDYQLLALGPTTALAATVHVEPGATAVPSSSALAAGSIISVEVDQGSAPLEGLAVSVEGTPVTATTDEEGLARLGVLPGGCFKLSTTSEGESRACSICPAPPIAAACVLDFPGAPDAGHPDAGHPDAGPVDAGPVDAGPLDAGSLCNHDCDQGLMCDELDGNCYQCVDPDDCGPNSLCVSHACVSTVGACQTCQGPDDCLDDCACIPVFDGGPKQCISGCVYNDDCNVPGSYGYVCANNLCLPSASQITSCISPAALGASCQDDFDCTRAGLVQGICESVQGQDICTVACAHDWDCPGSWSCQSDSGRTYCQPPPS